MGSEFSATFVGRLVTSLIQRVGPAMLGDNLDLLLKAVLSKLTGARTLSVIQSLVMVYAQLFHSQLDAVLQFLSNVPGPTGNSALHFVMTEWVSKHSNFYGSYETKVSTTALAKVLQHGVSNNDNRLNEIMVQGDQIHSEARVTRSSRRTEQWTQIPLLAKLFKLLVSDINDIIEEAQDEADSGDEDDDDEFEDDSQESDSSLTPNGKGMNLADLLAPAEDYLDEEVEEDDPDCKADPIYSLDMKQYLVTFIREFTVQPYFSHFTPHLNPSEQETIRSILAM